MRRDDAKDRMASESGFVCENASYCYSKTYCKHSNRDSYSTAKMYSQARNFKFIAEMISKLEFSCCCRSNPLFAIGSTFSVTLTRLKKNCKPRTLDPQFQKLNPDT